ncbi:MAG: lipid-A-disaccharide synthase [Helicobacteraceae bacterium]|jgi:lipid-A-disaccharide synthase|nr:lipid-A-disaccharide synthase [Helicobacteraceae bacterium]
MRILVSALEPSANLHLDALLSELKCEINGIFDSKFGEPIVDSKEFGAMGILGVLSKIPLAKKSMRKMLETAEKTELILLIDSPAFNIPLAKEIKAKFPQKKIIYYILPKVWAWKKNRIAVVEKYTDIQAAIFPFETMWWQNAVFVGNPLMKEIKTFNDNVTNEEIYSFLPGSRAGEIRRLTPIFREVAAKLNGRKILVIPPYFDQSFIDNNYGDLSGFEIYKNAREALKISKFSFVCSGTATLEAALIGAPFVLAYRAGALDFFIGRKFVKLPFVGLANIIFDFANLPKMHDELLQNDCTAEALLNSAKNCDKNMFLKRSFELRNMLNKSAISLTELIENAARY